MMITAMTNLQQVDYPDTTVEMEDLQMTENGVYKRTLRFSFAQYFNTGVYHCDYITNDSSTSTTTSSSFVDSFLGGLLPSYGSGGGGGGGYFGVPGGGPPVREADEEVKHDASVKVFVSGIAACCLLVGGVLSQVLPRAVFLLVVFCLRYCRVLSSC